MIADFYPVQVGWGDEVSTFEIKIECPETLKGCSSENIIKRGHDTKVKGHLQHYECTDCDRHFFPHISLGYAIIFEVIVELKLKES